MARLPIETGSGSAKNLSYLLFSMGDTRDKGLNAFVNGLSGFGNTLSAYHQQQRDFREKQQEKQRLESLELQKMQQQEAARLSDEAYRNAELGLKKEARLSDEAYRNAELGLRKEALEFEKYKYNNPIQKGELDPTPFAYGWENQNTQNAQNLQNQNTQNTQNTQMPKEQAEAIKPSTLRSAELSQFFKESDTNNTPAQNYTNQNYTNQNYTNQNYTNQNYNQGYNQNGTNQVAKYQRVITGIPYFDNKKILTIGDVIEAKKMGFDLFEERKDVNLKTADIGKSIEAVNEDIKSGIDAIKLSLEAKKQAGVMNGLARWAHRKTSGITHLSDEQSKYSVLDQSFTKSIARAEAGGKATNQQEKDAKEAYSTGFRDAREQRNAIAGGLEKIVRSLEKNMQNLEQKAEIRQETHNMHLMLKDYRDYLGSANYNDRRAQEMFNYIEKSEYGKNFNYDEWAKVRPKQNYSY